MLRLCTQESLLVGLKRPYGMPRIELWLATCKVSTCPALLWLWPLYPVKLSGSIQGESIWQDSKPLKCSLGARASRHQLLCNWLFQRRSQQGLLSGKEPFPPSQPQGLSLTVSIQVWTPAPWSVLLHRLIPRSWRYVAISSVTVPAAPAFTPDEPFPD